MEIQPKVVKNYVTSGGKVPFEEWIRRVKDKRTVVRILQRIDRLRLGNFGDCRSVGSGVYELRIQFGPGFRVYFGVADEQLIILLMAGDKSSQKKDIVVSKEYWKEYKDNAN
ncbi:MAG: type II toxin-antitoxin system RelE/ParE family toxin [Cyanobacteria bacterium J06581_3]